MATKDFDAMLAAKAGVRPTFKAGGQEFTVRARIPWAKFQKLMAMMQSEEVDERAATDAFFKAAIVPADRLRFLELLHYGEDEEEDSDDDRDDIDVIDISTLSDVTQWLVELYTGKAESDSSSSSDGSRATGPSPKVVSLTPRNASA